MTLTALGSGGSVAGVLDGARRLDGDVPHYATRVVLDAGTVVTIWSGDVAYEMEPIDLDAPGPRNRLHMVDGGWVLETG
jgi:hypothetical protein